MNNGNGNGNLNGGDFGAGIGGVGGVGSQSGGAVGTGGVLGGGVSPAGSGLSSSDFNIELSAYTPSPAPAPSTMDDLSKAFSPPGPPIDITTQIPGYEQAVAGQKGGYTFAGPDASKGIAGLIDWGLGVLAGLFGHAPGLIAYGGVQAGLAGTKRSLGGVLMGTLFSKDEYGNLRISSYAPSAPSSPSAPSTPSTPSSKTDGLTKGGFEGYGSALGIPYYEPIPVIQTKEGLVYTKPVGSNELDLSNFSTWLGQFKEKDSETQAQFSYSSDVAKEEAKFSQLASMLPIVGIILISALVAFRKGARV